MGFIDHLLIPCWTCSKCDAAAVTAGLPAPTFTTNALSYGCFASSPSDPFIWYDCDLLETFKSFSALHGLGASGKSLQGVDFSSSIDMAILLAGFLDTLRERYARCSDGAAFKIQAEQFEGTMTAYLARSIGSTELAELGVEDLPTGPFRLCPICAPLPPFVESSGQDYTYLYDYRRSVAFDVVNKLSHYASCGTASVTPPYMSFFFWRLGRRGP
jgi:hypothetical protein